jgi:hypothetical protein
MLYPTVAQKHRTLSMSQVGCGYSQGDPGYIERYSFMVDDLQKRAEEEILLGKL